MISRNQKMLLHLYKNAGKIGDDVYRGILAEKAGVTSAADPEMNQTGFEHSMAALEAMLFSRVDSGLLPDPIGKNRWIRTRDYWQRKLPRSGYTTTRQAYIIDQLWRDLQPYLEPGQRNINYLRGIVRNATGADNTNGLKKEEAAALIDALTDRLEHAQRQEPQCTTTADIDEIPF